MARVFLVTSHYMGVLYMRELMRAGENMGFNTISMRFAPLFAVWLIKGYFQITVPQGLPMGAAK